MIASLLLALTFAASPAPAPEPRPIHELWGYARSGLSLYLSPSRTQGGLGGGVGVRDLLSDQLFIQADLSYLALLGNVAELRVGAGLQRSGTWAPALLITGSLLFGQHLTFLTEDHPYPSGLPGWSLGLELTPIRFASANTTVAVLPLGLGWGLELPGVGWHYRVGFLEVATRF